MRQVVAALVGGLLVAGASCSAAAPKNIIMLIGDGCGQHHFAAGSIYRFGAPGRAAHDRFPVKLFASTYSSESGGYDPATVWTSLAAMQAKPTDSAAAATALATGVKTYNAAIGVGPDKQPLPNIVERAEARGKATGVVSTVPLSHATPAGFVAHQPSRSSYAAIASEMILRSAVDVIIGGGHPDFDAAGRPAAKADPNYVGGAETWAQVQAGRAGADADRDGRPDPFTLVTARSAVVKLASGRTPRRLLVVPPVRESWQAGRPQGKPRRPFDDPLLAAVPTLAEATAAALNVLDDDPDGLFLMVEGGAIDWASHNNDAIRMVEEVIDFQQAIEQVIAWVEQRSSWEETLVIVTADHETGCLTAPDGQLATALRGHRGELPALLWNSKGHTNSLVPVYARGAGSERLTAAATRRDPVRGAYLDNTDLAKAMFAAWR
ncbi:MAG: alkaline phosphatase [Fimbriimonadaceae bacterium]|nr:alkaline phosphatase [Fimbriimonadaceae bacterium]